MELSELNVKVNNIESRLDKLEDKVTSMQDELDYNTRTTQELKKDLSRLSDEASKKIESIIKEKVSSLLSEEFNKGITLLKNDIIKSIKTREELFDSKINEKITDTISTCLTKALNKTVNKLTEADCKKMVGDIVIKH